MALNTKKLPRTGGKFKRPPGLEAGNYPARLVQIIDLGMQPQRAWKGEDKPPKPMVWSTYEFLDEFMKDEEGNDMEDKPRWVSEDFPLNPLSSDLAKSTARYTALDPKLEYDGDWSKLIGAPCMVTLSADKDTKGNKDENGDPVIWNNVSSTQTMRAKDIEKAEGLKNPGKIFDMDDPDMDVFNALPEFLQEKIKSALDFGGSTLEKELSGSTSEAKEEPAQEEDDDAGDW